MPARSCLCCCLYCLGTGSCLLRNIPALDVSASYDAKTQQGAIFMVNRSLTDSVTTDTVWQDGKAVQVDQAWQLAGSDPKEGNIWEMPDRLVAKAISAPAVAQPDAGTLDITNKKVNE